MERKWWMSAVGYQIYPRTFFDSNNDGIGDLKGIIQKLDYIHDLGINLIWIGPFYKSPMDDNGYDVSDFFDVDPVFGTLEDARELVSEAHKRDIKVALDLVLNHTSDEHSWFMESRSSIDNPKRDYYIWQKGKLDQDGKLLPPNNWGSFFEGSAWNYDEKTQEFYMKIFSNKMPDLNWDNPKLRDEMYHVARYWLDFGVDGFRVDAIAHLARDLSFEDSLLPLNTHGVSPDWSKFSNRPELFTYINEFHDKVLSQYDCMTVGEVGGGARIEAGLGYAAYDARAFNMAFNFDHCWETSRVLDEKTNQMKNVTNVRNLKRIFNYWIEGMDTKGWLPQYWLNHDHPRVMNQYGDPVNYHYESGSMLGSVLLTLPGTPFIYNGEEIGMTNVDYTDVNDFNDVWVKNNVKKLLEHDSMENVMDQLRRTSRDNARTPMQWSDDIYAGFSKVKPVQKEISNYVHINVKKQLSDEQSILKSYKKLIHLRRFSEYSDLLVFGKFKLLDADHEDVFAYERYNESKKLRIIANFRGYSTQYEVNNHKVIFSNYNRETSLISELKPFEVLILEIEHD